MITPRFIIDTQSFLDRYHNAIFLVLFLLLIAGEFYLYQKMVDNANKREDYLRVISTFDQKIDELNMELRTNNQERKEYVAMIKRLEKDLKVCEKKLSS